MKSLPHYVLLTCDSVEEAQKTINDAYSQDRYRVVQLIPMKVQGGEYKILCVLENAPQ